MSESVTSGGKRLRVEKPGSTPQLVLWKHLLPLLRSIVRRMGGDLQIDGATSLRMGEDGSLMFKVSPGAAVTPTPFMIHDDGKIEPGIVGGVMPTLDGEPLDTTTNVLDLTSDDGNFFVCFKLVYPVTYLEGYLTHNDYPAVTVETYTSDPTPEDTSSTSTQYIQFNTVTAGKPAPSYYSTSIPCFLADNGLNKTQLMGA